jgi:hypothetical protein
MNFEQKTIGNIVDRLTNIKGASEDDFLNYVISLKPNFVNNYWKEAIYLRVFNYIYNKRISHY